MTSADPPEGIHRLLFEDTVRLALQEDMGRAGDITSAAVVPSHVLATGHLVARAAGCIAGLKIALSAFELVDPEVVFRGEAGDGEVVKTGRQLAVVEGRARSLLMAERTALNFLGRLSGIATATRELVNRVAGTRARIVCTRKTTPGLRALEKYAVRIGGGFNHRFGLDDAVLIKDNHLVAAGGVRPALNRVRLRLGHMVKVEIEVDGLEQLQEALDVGVDAVLLDNMPPELVRQAVELVRGRCLVEVSGGITLQSVRTYAETGVDLISVGWLTHSASSLDVALDLAAVN